MRRSGIPDFSAANTGYLVFWPEQADWIPAKNATRAMTPPSPTPLPDLSPLRPSEAATALLDRLRLQITDDMLREIAEADYGMGAENHLAALRLIQGRRIIPTPLDWEPAEVLELTSYLDPDDVQGSALRFGQPGHLKRLFCCTVLLYGESGSGEQRGVIVGVPDTLARFVASAIALQQDYVDRARQFLAWWLPKITSLGEDPAFAALGLLILTGARDQRDTAATCLAELSGWLEAKVDELMESEISPHPRYWLLGCTYFASERDTWRELAERWLLAPNPELPADIRATLERIGRCSLQK